jgi:hypothetical protein
MARKQNARSAFFGIYSVFRVAFLHMTAASIHVVGLITTRQAEAGDKKFFRGTGLLSVLSLFSSLEDLIRPRQHVGRNRQADLLCLFEIVMNSNFVGCSTGMSAGFVPFRILSTKTAARRAKWLRFVA